MLSRYFQVGASLVASRQNWSFLARQTTGKVLCFFVPAKRSICSPSNMKDSTLRFTKITENAFAPTRGSKKAAGYDLCSAYDYVVPSKGKFCCLTDLKIAVPEGSYGRIAPRSGLAHKNFIDIGAGVIDHDYRGNVGVILFNFSDNDFEVKKGDRIAQLICEKIYYPEIEEVQTLDDTVRGERGFGSSGKN